MIIRDGFRAAAMDVGAKLALEKVADGIVQNQQAYNVNTATTTATLTAANITGGSAEVILNMTGTLGAGVALTLPTVADLVRAIADAAVNQTYRLRIWNGGAGAFAWTVTTNTGWTLTGTMTVAQNTYREFLVTLTSKTTATLQSLGTVAVTAL